MNPAKTGGHSAPFRSPTAYTRGVKPRPVAIHQHEHRLPVVIATLVNLVLILLIPEKVQLLPTWVIPVLGVLLMTPLIAFNPRRFTRESTWSRWLSIALAILLKIGRAHV